MNHDIPANKSLVTDLLTSITSGGDISTFFTDDASWWVPEGCVLGGTYPIQDLLTEMAGLFGKFKAPPVFDVHYLTAEENRVAVFCDSSSELINGGGGVNNNYHFLFFCRDGCIFHVKEFLNTAVVNATLKRIQSLD